MIPYYINFEHPYKTLQPINPFTAYNAPLVLFIDKESFVGDEKENLDFLLKQAGSEKLTVISTGEEGNAQLQRIPEENDILQLRVVYFDGPEKGEKRCGIPMVSQYKEMAAGPEFTRWATTDEVERAFVTAKISEEIEAHTLVTNDQFLLNHRDLGVITESNPLSVAETIALIGLFQRRCGNYSVVVSRLKGGQTGTFSYARWLFFWYTSRDLLPSSWQLVSGCAQMSNKRCGDMALTAISRVSDVLKCRDHIHEQLFLEQTNSSTEDAVFYLDFYLLSLTAAFDVLARVANTIYMPEYKGSISWRNKKWLNPLYKKDSTLADLMAKQAFARDILDLVAGLRNYIHEERLQGAMHSKNGEPAPTLLRVPEDKANEIKEITERVTDGDWIVDASRPYATFVEIGEFVERVTPMAMQAIEGIMQAIDVTRVPNYDSSKIQVAPPQDWPSKEEIALLRKLLGI